MEREMICIVCPVGCRMKVGGSGEDIRVTGNACKRGARYAVSEFTDPQRTVTSSVYVTGGNMPLVSVRTEKTVPKAKISQVMQELKKLTVAAPVKVGQVLLHDAAGTGVDIIATREIRAEK
ncbi:MAG: DUF1667 domain-containing protein [Eubacteriales bacterium]|nr:DUF1667 domain-containing protein [Eubacteriales bacterium]